MSKQGRLVDRIGVFTGIPNSFIKNSAARSCYAFRLFVILRFLTNSETETAFPSFDKMRELTGMHKRHIAQGLRELEAHGWLERKKRFGKPVIYTILDPTRISESEEIEPCISSTPAGTTDTRLSNSTVGTASSTPAGTTVSLGSSKTEITKTERGAATPLSSRRCPSCNGEPTVFERNAYWQCSGCGTYGDIRAGALVVSMRKGKAAPARTPKSRTLGKSHHPAVLAIKRLDLKKKSPPADIHDLLISVLGETPDIEWLGRCKAAWTVRGYNRFSYVWATEWYADGIPDKNTGNIIRPPSATPPSLEDCGSLPGPTDAFFAPREVAV